MGYTIRTVRKISKNKLFIHFLERLLVEGQPLQLSQIAVIANTNGPIYGDEVPLLRVFLTLSRHDKWI